MSAWKDTRVWLKGLISVAIGAAAGSVSVLVVDPETFNFSTGFVPLLKVAAITAIIAIANYLKASPLPESKGAEATVKTEVASGNPDGG